MELVSTVPGSPNVVKKKSGNEKGAHHVFVMDILQVFWEKNKSLIPKIYNVLFASSRKLFWTDLGVQPVVETASLEGKNRVIIARTDLVSPSGLTIDFTEDRLFWCDQRRGVVETAALDGSDRRVVLGNQVGEACVIPV